MNGNTSTLFTVQKIEKYTVIEFKTPSLMNPSELEQIATDLYRLVDEEDRRYILLDFEKVKYLSSQAIGIVLTLHKKLSQLKKSSFVLVGVGPSLMQLLKITRLDKVLKIKDSQREGVKVEPNV